MSADDRIEAALRRIGAQHSPPAGYEARVLAAVTQGADDAHALSVERAEKVLITALLICRDDAIATHDVLVQAIILHAALQSENHETVDQFLSTAVHALVAAFTTDEERTQV